MLQQITSPVYLLLIWFLYFCLQPFANPWKRKWRQWSWPPPWAFPMCINKGGWWLWGRSKADVFKAYIQRYAPKGKMTKPYSHLWLPHQHNFWDKYCTTLNKFQFIKFQKVCDKDGTSKDRASSEKISMISGILTFSFVIALSKTFLWGSTEVVKTGAIICPLWKPE